MKKFLILFLVLTVISCGEINKQYTKVVSPETTERTEVFCSTLFGVPVLCLVEKDRVTRTEIREIVEVVIEKIIVIEKQVEVPVETIVERVVKIFIEVPAATETIESVTETVVDEVIKTVPESSVINTPINDVVDTVNDVIESTPPVDEVDEVVEVIKDVVEGATPDGGNTPNDDPIVNTPPINVNPPVNPPPVVETPVVETPVVETPVVEDPATDVEDLVNDHNENPSAAEKAVNSQGLHTHRLMHTHWISDKWGNLVEKKEHTHENLEHSPHTAGREPGYTARGVSSLSD